MTNTKDGGQAFPSGRVTLSRNEQPPYCSGMTLRDYFAANFDASGIEMSNDATVRMLGESMPDMSGPEAIVSFGLKAAAKVSYIYADAMIEAREQTKLAGEPGLVEELTAALTSVRPLAVQSWHNSDRGTNYEAAAKESLDRIDAALARAGEAS